MGDRQVICIHFSTQYAKSRAPRVHHAQPGVFFFLKPPRKEKRIASISILEPSASTDVPAFRGVDLHQEAERNSQARTI